MKQAEERISKLKVRTMGIKKSKKQKKKVNRDSGTCGLPSSGPKPVLWEPQKEEK